MVETGLRHDGGKKNNHTWNRKLILRLLHNIFFFFSSLSLFSSLHHFHDLNLNEMWLDLSISSSPRSRRVADRGGVISLSDSSTGQWAIGSTITIATSLNHHLQPQHRTAYRSVIDHCQLTHDGFKIRGHTARDCGIFTLIKIYCLSSCFKKKKIQ